MKSFGLLAISLSIAALVGCNDEPENPATQSQPSASVSNVPPPPVSSSTAPADKTNSTSNLPTELPAGANLANWEPDKAVLDQLGEYTDIQGYQIRVPKEFGETTVQPIPNAVGKGWKRKGNRDTIQFVNLYIITPPEGELPPSNLRSSVVSCQALEGFLKDHKTAFDDWQSKDIETGKINGIVFCRAVCQGKTKEYHDEASMAYYVAFHENRFILVMIYSFRTDIVDASNLGNASVLTIRKK